MWAIWSPPPSPPTWSLSPPPSTTINWCTFFRSTFSLPPFLPSSLHWPSSLMSLWLWVVRFSSRMREIFWFRILKVMLEKACLDGRHYLFEWRLLFSRWFQRKIRRSPCFQPRLPMSFCPLAAKISLLHVFYPSTFLCVPNFVIWTPTCYFPPVLPAPPFSCLHHLEPQSPTREGHMV